MKLNDFAMRFSLPIFKKPFFKSNKINRKNNSNQKSKLRKILEPIAFVLAGLLCFSYPLCSTLWNNRVTKEISTAYDKFNHNQAAMLEERIYELRNFIIKIVKTCSLKTLMVAMVRKT